jgi:hypothetical protein
VFDAPRLRRTLAAAALVMPACGAPTIDGSSPEAVKASIEQVERELSVDDRREFEGAVRFVVADALAANLEFGAGSTADDVNRRVIEQLEGKTARDVIALVEEIRAERALRRARPAPPPRVGS